MSDRGNILAVDDTPASLKLLSDILSDEGYNVRPARSGELALESAFITPPDLFLLDICMPNMDGFEVCRQLKANPKTRNIPVVFLSALSEVDEKVRGFSLGAVDFVTKPFQREELLARVHTHLEMHHLRTHLEKLVAERTDDLELSEDKAQRSLLELVEAVKARNESDHTLRLALQAGHLGSWEFDVATGKAISCAQTYKIFGYDHTPGIWDYDAFLAHVVPEDRDSVASAIRLATETKTEWHRECRIQRVDGEFRWVEFHGGPYCDSEDRSIRMHGTIADITERKTSEAQIQFIAHHDPLTGLPNRLLIEDRITQSIAFANRTKTKVALFFLADISHMDGPSVKI